MWAIVENEVLDKKWRKLQPQVLKKYELWKSIIRYNGPQKLKEFPGFHDEALKGEWSGCRSSRLSLQFRVIYQVFESELVVQVEDSTPHHY